MKLMAHLYNKFCSIHSLFDGLRQQFLKLKISLGENPHLREAYFVVHLVYGQLILSADDYLHLNIPALISFFDSWLNAARVNP